MADVSRVAALVRAELDVLGLPHAKSVTDQRLHDLWLKVGQDTGLAADALIQWPRPDWLTSLCGPYPMCELANPQDILDSARPGAW